jgi:hypothetical protein
MLFGQSHKWLRADLPSGMGRAGTLVEVELIGVEDKKWLIINLLR